MDKEIEYKWNAHSLRDYHLLLQLAQDFGAKISKPKQVKNKDLYLDTPENYFLSSGLECRIRITDGHTELTLKSFSDPKQEIFIRDEKTIRFPDLKSKMAVLAYCRDNYFKNIQPLFELRNNRQINMITLPCKTRAEANFDQVLMFCGEKKFRMKEIELEFKSGKLEKFKEFVGYLTSLPLTPSKSSKFEQGMVHLKGVSGIEAIQKFHEAANKILEINVDKLKKNQDSLIASDKDPEKVHDLRVATRRLRAAIRVFKRILPAKAKKIRNELGKMGRKLGKKRDLDVFSAFISQTVDAESVSLQKLNRQICRAQNKILSTLKSKHYARLLKRLENLEAERSKKNIFKISRDWIRKKLCRVLKIASIIDARADDKTLHKLRISIKILRYVCEFFEPLFSKYVCSLGPFIEKTIKIQDVLGDHQDAIKGMSMLVRYKNQFSRQEFMLIKREYELKKKRARKVFIQIWKDYWYGEGFRRSSPKNAIELLL